MAKKTILPGENPQTWDTTEEMGEPSFLIGDAEWVTAPPGLGVPAGTRLYIKGKLKDYPCPKCGGFLIRTAYRLDHNIAVFDCASCNEFLWGKLRG
jgi:predicted RNA-binding Zn-ribbon protein involved in translation (DUF1610 family)